MVASTPSVVFHIVGDAFVDLLALLEKEWPESGGDSYLIEPVRSYAGGSSLNTATHLHVMILQQQPLQPPFKVALYTVLNENDHYGQILLCHAKDHGFSLHNCRNVNSANSSSDRSTGHCIAIVSRGDRSFMTHHGCIHQFSPDQVPWRTLVATVPEQSIVQHQHHQRHIHIAGYYNLPQFHHGALRDELRAIRTTQQDDKGGKVAISLATQHDATNQWDGGLEQLLPLLDLVFLNQLEATHIVNQIKCRTLQNGVVDEKECAKAAVPVNDATVVSEWVHVLSSSSPTTYFVVTRGADGAIVFAHGVMLGQVQAAIHVPVTDPTGAGDSFTAGFLYGLYVNRTKDMETGRQGQSTHFWSTGDINYALRWGCAAGTATVQIRGASTPAKFEEIQRLFNML